MNKKHQPPLNYCPCCNPALDRLVQAFLSRRQFMVLGAGAFASAIALSEQANASPRPSLPVNLPGQVNIADTIYINAEVITVNDTQPNAEAVAVKDGKILAVGSNTEISLLKTSTTQVIDLSGKVLVPGFIDAHGHMFGQGIATTVARLLPPPDGDVDTIAKLQEKLRVWGERSAARELGWIVGHGYDDSQLKEQRHPTRAELDAVSTEIPILAIHQSGHLVAINSKALELSGITAETPNPPGGVIRRQAGSNEPDSVLEENASHLALDAMIRTANIGADILTLVQKGAELYASYGFTTAQEGRASKPMYEAVRTAADASPLPIDVAVYPDYVAHPDAHTWGMSRTYTNRVRLAGIKISADGSPQGRTAWLTEPYYQPPEGQPADYRGYGVLTDEQLIDRLDSAYKNNVQPIIHSNGDASIDQLIMAIRTVNEKYGPADRRPVVIHGQTVRDDQLDQMKELGMFPALYPAHVFYWGDWHREVTLGPERADHISPMRSALDRGLKATIHTDSPVVLPHGTRTIWSAVNRRTRTDFLLGADQCLTPLEALKALTIWAAYQHFEEDQKGSIEVGKLADFAILSANPLTVDPMTIRDIEVVETIKEGKTVYKVE